MVLFARVVEAGSFAAAAKSLGQTRAAVSKQIASLEERIGAQLLQRTTRSMHLTEIGKEFYSRCARIAEEAAEAESAVASLQSAPRGELRIAAPVTFGRRYLTPLVSPFLEAHPEISIELALSDAEPPLGDEGFDVAVRIAPRVESGYVARLLAPSPHVLCASPAYWGRHGVPRTPEELRDHECLLYSSLATPRIWRFREGKSVRVRGRFAMTGRSPGRRSTPCTRRAGTSRRRSASSSNSWCRDSSPNRRGARGEPSQNGWGCEREEVHRFRSGGAGDGRGPSKERGRVHGG
jgi:DNA-binding transcriptional LysR family regulator